MKRNSVQRLRSFFQNQVGRFLATQLTHTVITAVILIGFFFGATQVGALDGVLAPAVQTTGDSFTTINYQGRLADPDGAPISDTLTFQFSLYDAPSDGNLLWGPEVHADVPVSDGLFSVRLGQQDALPTNIFNGGDVWLETTVKGETLSPREKLAAVPYAMVSGEALTVPDGAISAEKLASDLAVQGDFIVNEGTLYAPKRINFEAPASSSVHGPLEHEGINASDAALLVPTYSGGENSDIRLYILDNASDRFSIWGESCAGGDCGDLNSASESHRFRADGDAWHKGNVGIGTTEPQVKLDVQGTTIVRGSNLDPENNPDFSMLDQGLMIGRNRTGGEGEVDFISDRGGGDQGGFRFYDKDESENLNFLMSIRGNGNVTVGGNFNVSGSKSAVVETESYGERKLYAFEQPTNRFGDEGRAELVDGAARVELDPIFLETVEDDFLIHLTPYGDASLYVAEIGADYFVVQACEGADDVPFAWMLTATRSGYEGVRLEEVQEQE